MKKRLSLLVPVLLFSFFSTRGQGELPVNMYTGSPIIAVPIYSVSAPGLNESINLIYNSSGVKVDAPTGDYGVNWSVNAGGSIRREVRGLPDDYSRDGTGTTMRKGWLYQNLSGVTVAADVASLPNTSDLSSACPKTDETADYEKLNSLAPIYDTEPDLFSYSAGGYSGKFVFDNGPTPQIRLIPYQDISIVPTFTSATDKTIVSFTITTNTGEVYLFDYTNTETRWTQIASLGTEIYKAEVDYYKASSAEEAISYKTTWLLTKATSRSGGEITYGYAGSDPASVTTNNKFSVRLFKSNGSGYTTDNIYNDYVKRNGSHLSFIRVTWGASVGFQLTDGLVTAINVYDSRDGDEKSTSSKFVKKYVLTYSGGIRQMLMSIQEISGNESLPPYKFGYWGWPMSNTKGQDLWGYYNGKTTNAHLYPKLYVYPALPSDQRFRIQPIAGYSGDTLVLPGADRTVNPELIKNGSLNSITWPWGGVTTLEYESNQYYDPVSGTDMYGGGIRIKSATYLDGTNPDASIEKNFTYRDSLNWSSGVLITPPQFVIPLWENREGGYNFPYQEEEGVPFMKHFIARTDRDISSRQETLGSAVGYREVKVFRPESGYAHYEYELPATVHTQVKLARGGTSCNAENIFSQFSFRMFPYAPNAETDFTRGQVKRKREYDEGHHLIRDIKTTYRSIYKQGSSPFTVSGVRYERIPNGPEAMFLFGKYSLPTGEAKVTATETVTTFDAADVSKRMTHSAAYFYESTSHRLMTRVLNIAPDGTRQTKSMKYPLDYGTIPASPDVASAALGRLQTAGLNGIPIEQCVTMKRPGGVVKVVGASVIKFSAFGGEKALPQYTYKWSAATPLDSTSFVQSKVNASGAFIIDPGYSLTNSYLAYDTLDMPTVSVGLDSVPVTTVWSTKLGASVATVANALPGQFAFSDFETGTEASFDLQEDSPDMDAIVRMTSAHSGRWSLYPEAKLSKVITKAENTYRLSGWWSKGLTQITVNIAIMNTQKTVTYSTQSYILVSSASLSIPWDYFSVDVPVSTAPSEFLVEISFVFSGSYVSGTIAIDDFAFCPKHSVLTSSTYTFPFGTDSSTSGDRCGYQVYDNLGRVKLVLDRDRNIIQKKTYQFLSQQ